MQLSSYTLSATLELNGIVTQTMIITNSGSMPLEFAIAEGYPLGDYQDINKNYPSGTVLLMHMDEPTGATTFYDSSGYDNHGTCSGDTCPDAGLPGIFGNAIKFDGNDFITVPNIQQLNPVEAVSFSVWIYPYDWNSNRRILQKGSGDNQYILGCNGGTGGTLELKLFGVGVLDTNLPTPNAWHHVVGLYDGSSMEIWVDGQLIAEKPVSGQIATTNEPLYIGTKHAGAPPSDYFNGLMDDLLIVDRALTPDEIIFLYQGVNPTAWLSLQPITGTIPVAEALPVQVTYQSSNMQPGIYNTTLYMASNDLLQPHFPIPVTMTVEPTQHMGWVEGIITDLRTGEPLEATIVAEGQPYTVTSDIETGYYKLWLEPGLYNFQVSAAGYIGQTAPVRVRNRHGVTQDFALMLDAPWLGYSPGSLESTQEMGQVETQTLTLSNTGAALLEFTLGEGTSDSLLTLHLDEPTGSTFFNDTSGNEHHGSCSSPSCPTAQVPGILGSAVDFDGEDDAIALGTWFNMQSFTIAMWIKEDPGQQVDCADIIDNYHYGGRSWVVQKCWNDNPTDKYYFHVANNETLIQFGLNPGIWQFLVVTVDESTFMSNVYLDGNLVGTATGSSPINYDGSQFLQLGNWGGGGRYWNGSLDEVMIFDQAITPEQVQRLYRNRYSGYSSWLSIAPISGTVPADTFLPIQVTFNSTDLQPDTYTTTLYVTSNDPLNPLVELPVTMTVTPPAWYGELNGISLYPRIL